jgi:hypothetical protein
MERIMHNKHSSIILRILSLALIAIALGACASGPKVFVNQNPDIDFSNFKTYNFEERLGTDSEVGYNSLFSKYLMKATSLEMEARGYTRSNNPDLTINFGLATKEKIRSTTTPNSNVGGYYGYRGYGAYGGSETTVTQYTEGTFNIDIVDATGPRKMLAWECVLEGRMTDKFRNDMEGSVNKGITEIFDRYPYFAAGFVPPVETTEAK